MFTIWKSMNIRLLFSQCSCSWRNSSRVADPPYFHSIIWYRFLMYCRRVHAGYRQPGELLPLWTTVFHDAPGWPTIQPQCGIPIGRTFNEIGLVKIPSVPFEVNRPV
jgi:hypothetical protein